MAELYGVSTSRLNEQVRRNIDRFPNDFMFQLTDSEFSNLKSQIATSSWGGRRKLPLVLRNRECQCSPVCCTANGPSESILPSCGPLSSFGRCCPPTRNWRRSFRNWNGRSGFMIKPSSN
ncbi:MAG: ORF6N domain-containing protein [Leptospirales bacterium]